MSKTDQQFRGFLFTIMILHRSIKYRVTPVTVRSYQHPVSHRHIVLSKPNKWQSCVTFGTNINANISKWKWRGKQCWWYDADISGFAVMFQFGWEPLSKLRRKSSVYEV